MGGWPGEVEEEGRAVEGKQGMEEVTWTDWSVVVVNKDHDGVWSGTRSMMSVMITCSMEAGSPGRPMEEETLGAVK